MDEKGFINSWVLKLKEERIKSFPDDFSIDTKCETFTLNGKRILIGEKFFGEHELIDAEGKEILRVESYEKAKYFIYANRNRPKTLTVPTNNLIIKEMISAYEKYLDSILKRIDQDIRYMFPTLKNTSEIINRIFDHLNLIRL